ncbi:MAG: CHASE2 domain-containing protein, partial [Geminicoccaceae bacterium]|nr:CHASE2 domain-containing protein [Geminicoccaceae bacterium]
MVATRLAPYHRASPPRRTRRGGPALPESSALRHLVLALAIGIAGAVAALTPWAHRVEETYGLYALFTLRGPQPPPEAIEIVGLDEASLERLRALPADPRAWPGPLGTCAERFERLEAIRELRSLDRIPRVLHACLVETLRARGARAIVFDIA